MISEASDKKSWYHNWFNAPYYHLAVEPAPIRDPAVADAVRACRDKLPPQPRAAIRARIESYGVVSDEELAAELEMRPNTFLQNVTRARRLLAECLRLRGIDLALEMR